MTAVDRATGLVTVPHPARSAPADGTVSGQKSDEFLAESERLLFAVAARPTAEQAEASLAARLPDRRGVLAMTNERVLWIRQSPMGNATGDVLAQYRHDELAAVDWNADDTNGDRRLNMTFTDGSAASLQIR